MRLRRRFLFGVVLALGAAVVVLPAMAVEANPTIQAENLGPGLYGEEHRWSPAHATIAPGGTVTLANPTEVKHGVEWVSTPGGAKPSCDADVPVGTEKEASGTKWSGACTFTTAGTYVLYCTVHGAAMSATITVGSEGTTITSGPSTPGSGTESQSAPGAGAGAPGQASPTIGAGALGSLLAGSASSAVRLASIQHGHSVHGSVAVSGAAGGGTLAVALLARSASLASAGPHHELQVGHSVRAALHPGTASFTVALSARARRALRAHGRLALTVRIVITSARGASVTVTRSVVVRG